MGPRSNAKTQFLHDHLHLILYGISGLDDYLIVLSMNNTGICPLQPTRNEVQGLRSPMIYDLNTCTQCPMPAALYIESKTC